MNISQPVSSSIEGVDFGILSSDEIKKLSVKRITQPNALDLRLYPIPGGLYDLALGAFLDNPCATCHSSVANCPGHCGHIELPVKVYHCVFMDQAYRLLKAKCAFCHHLKMSRVEINLFYCKLKLIRHGLLREAEEIGEVEANPIAIVSTVADDDGDASAAEDDRMDSIMSRREAYVRTAIKRSGSNERRNNDLNQVNEAVAEARSNIIKHFLTAIGKPKACGRCKGISPGWRKNKYTSIFQLGLSPKDISKNVAANVYVENPLVELNRLKETARRKAHRAAQMRRAERERNGMIDEGVADLDDSSAHDSEDAIMLDASIDQAISGSEALMEDEDEDDSESLGFSEGSLIAGEARQERRKRKKPEERAQTYVNAIEVHAALVHLFEREREIFGLLYGSKSGNRPNADMFFIEHMVVPPNKYRKESRTGPNEISESSDNTSYRTILSLCIELYQVRKEIAGSEPESTRRIRNFDDLQKTWLSLQDAVNSLIDSDRNPMRGPAALRNPNGIKQKLEKKEGVFRMNIMGKRVNFAARSVISPDPNIETNEIGIPPVFAKKLTYPEPVTSHTFEELKQAVINGPDKWPGAVAIENENGQITTLRHQNAEERLGIANQLLAPSNTIMNGAVNKKVHRHLNNGDIVIMNRQPTLHKPSMMCHRARVLQGEKTIRMHYANCKTYNADFDGDEMNLHFPQNEIARAEALQIADTDHQYISATAGEPLRGLIQDHISISVWLCNKDTFFDRENYFQLLYASLRPESEQTSSERIQTLEPAVIRPHELWTGKQVISTVLLNITPHSHHGLNLTSKSSIASNCWGVDSEEGQVCFKDGELAHGILDKKQIGPSAGGLVHAVYEAYGHTIAGRLLSILGRLLTKLLNMYAFSCGVEDLILTDKGESDRSTVLASARKVGLAVASKYVRLENDFVKDDDAELLNRLESVLRDEGKQVDLDAVMNSSTALLSSEITKACLPDELVKPFPRNQMQMMTTSGAKGTQVNANLISCNLGQQVLEGRRVPTMISGKTLPSFRPFETNVRAGGYIMDRFLTGVRPQEYFFHTMAGREGLIDTAVKTSRSGYLQRCLVKGMEGLRVEYDTSVRDSDGTLVQSLYGEDGLDVAKQQSISDFKFVAQNIHSVSASLHVGNEMKKLISKEARDWNKLAIKRVQKTGNLAAMDPALHRFNPDIAAGSTSETFYLAAKKYIEENPDNMIIDGEKRSPEQVKKKIFEKVLNLNYMKSVIQPGEAIGVVAAQSIGEPSTQMTLNTFHLAGHSAKNVTLGIPRLREILMTASMNIKTPSMTLRLIPGLSEDDGRKFAKGISRLSLASVLDHIIVTESIGHGIHIDARKYSVRLQFFPSGDYCEEYAIKIPDVVSTVVSKFVPLLHRMIRAEIKKRGLEKSLKSASKTDAIPEIGKSAGRVREEVANSAGENEAGESDDEDGGDDDATDAKRKVNLDEGTTYEDPDEEEQQIEEQGELEAYTEEESHSEDSTYGGTVKDADDTGDTEKRRSEASNLHKERESRVKSRHADISAFHFDDDVGAFCEMVFEYPTSSPKVLVLPLAEKAARMALIQSINGIAACMYNRESITTTDPFTHEKRTEENVASVITEGINLMAMRDYQQFIVPQTLSTNDVGAMLQLYGVEAARATIIRETRAVFASHHIEVDQRHLTLIADYMTRGGGYQAFSRVGMRTKTGVFGKMSFETTVAFLREAVLNGQSENLIDPSARITVGKVGSIGTGAFDVMTPVA